MRAYTHYYRKPAVGHGSLMPVYREDYYMQKFIFIETYAGGNSGLENINSQLDEGWKVVEIHASKPSKGDNIRALVLIEKEKKAADRKKPKQKIICLSQGGGTPYDKLNALLEDGWTIRQMQAGSSAEGSSCYVWLEKED